MGGDERRCRSKKSCVVCGCCIAARQLDGTWMVPISSDASSSVVPIKSYDKQASTTCSAASVTRGMSSPAEVAPLCTCVRVCSASVTT